MHQLDIKVLNTDLPLCLYAGIMFALGAKDTHTHLHMLNRANSADAAIVSPNVLPFAQLMQVFMFYVRK